MYKNIKLEDVKTLTDYHIQRGETIDLNSIISAKSEYYEGPYEESKAHVN